MLIPASCVQRPEQRQREMALGLLKFFDIQYLQLKPVYVFQSFILRTYPSSAASLIGKRRHPDYTCKGDGPVFPPKRSKNLAANYLYERK